MSKYIDNVNITDEIGPNGLVIIKDKDGNVLVKKHNMVVKTGKDIVFNKFINSSNEIAPEDSPKNFKLYKLYFGDSLNETIFSYNELDKFENGKFQYPQGSDDLLETYGTIGETNDGHNYICFSLSNIICDPNVASYISTLSLTAKYITTPSNLPDKEVLFSRIKFDPIPMVEGNELTLLYYIYF